ncbi:MAG: phosphate ABC transporter ATP-binding protein [Rhodospirillales bacterium]|nr:phosphate ABC transporter ATP-binding protein [Rhodospirillales bacterium]
MSAELTGIEAGEAILPLQLTGLRFEAAGKHLIKDITLTLEAGSRTMILGPNGAGKSLLLRLCHGLIEPSAGSITWQGPGGGDAQSRQAMVFQRPVMLRRSVAANVAFGLKLQGFERAKRAELVDDMLHKTGLKRLASSPARSLSFGEQQRLAVARAWTLKPQVLFLDEPTANLDPAATHALEELLQAISRSGTKIIMSTHDLMQAKRLADEVVFLYRGRLLEFARADQFFEMPENDLAQAFLRGELLWWRRQPLKPPGAPKS